MKPLKDARSIDESEEGPDTGVWRGLSGDEHSRADAALVEDELNYAIITMLQEDGRMSYAAIARKLEVSEGFVRHRVTRLMEAKVFKVIAVADPMAMGYKAYAMVAMKLSPGANPRALAEHFRDCPEAVYVLFTAGHFDLLVEVICRTYDEFRNFLVDKCYARPEIASVEPMMGLEMYKYLLKWNRPEPTNQNNK